MKAFKTVTDPEAFQLMADETRRRIIYMLRAKEMTVAQLAEALSLTPQAVYHHIRKLKDADLVEIGKEERVGHLIETYYRASAEMFHFQMGGEQSAAVAEAQEEEAIRNLPRLGFDLRLDPESLAKIIELQKQLKCEEGTEGQWLEKIGALEDVDFLTKQSMEHYTSMLVWTDEEFSDYIRVLREQRKLLKSLLPGEPVQVHAKSRSKGT